MQIIISSKMASTAFARGANSINSIFLKPIARKGYHKNPGEVVRESMKMEGEEVKKKSANFDGNNPSWVPHERTGIYYPKGHEKVIQDLPPKAAKDMHVNWFSHNDTN